MRYALLILVLTGCPETGDAECELHPGRRVCVDACIFEIEQPDCIPIVDACEADPDLDRCDVLLDLCNDMPSALGCGGTGADAGGTDVT